LSTIDPVHEAAMLALCDRFFGAITRGDIEEVRSIYAPRAVIWHNHQANTENVEENLRVLALATQFIAGFRYEDVVRRATADGFVQRHVLRGRTPLGDELTVPACLVCTVDAGSIVRVDEYMDSAHLAPLQRRA
jgi:ketosteroid isomerase-like protein